MSFIGGILEVVINSLLYFNEIFEFILSPELLGFHDTKLISPHYFF